MNNNDDIKAASFKFNTNLIKLSTSDNIEEAKKEWEFIMKTTEKTNNNICICQHKIKHISYFYNIKNKNIIICGSKCCQNFNFHTREMKNKMLSKILSDNITKGEYKEINCVLKYSEEMKEQVIKYIETEYIRHKNNRYELKLLLNNLLEIIDYYNFNNLELARIKFKEQIEKLEKEEIEWQEQQKEKEKELKRKNEDTKENQEKKTKEQNEYDSNIRMLNIYYNSNKDKYDNNELISIIKYNMQIYKILDINEIINYKQLNQKNEKIKIQQHNINIWSCRFCNLSKPEMNGSFFNDMICIQCARQKNYCLSF